MKKLKLDLQSLNAEVLTRSQLKQILGGDGGSGGCSGGTSCSDKTCSKKEGNKITMGTCSEHDTTIGCLCLCSIAGGTGC